MLVSDSGVKMVKALFVENRWEQHRGKHALFAIASGWEDKEVDGVLYPNLGRLYLECGDITEAEFVRLYFDSNVDHWGKIQAQYPEEVSLWRRTLSLRLQGNLVKNLYSDAMDPESKSATSSAKYLLDKLMPLPGVKDARVGRPRKNKNLKSQEEENEIASLVRDDLLRVLKGTNHDGDGSSGSGTGE